VPKNQEPKKKPAGDRPAESGKRGGRSKTRGGSRPAGPPHGVNL